MKDEKERRKKSDELREQNGSEQKLSTLNSQLSTQGVFCIIKYRICFVRDYETTEYARLDLTQNGFEYSTTVISSKQAQDTIDEYNMCEKVNNKYGRVWEIPRKSFRRRYRGN